MENPFFRNSIDYFCRILWPGWISREHGFARGILILSGWPATVSLGILQERTKNSIPS